MNTLNVCISFEESAMLNCIIWMPWAGYLTDFHLM